jgi:prepilin-type N-terminal cleavage/methylation domain-containing protein
MRRTAQGFTLIEIMVVITIIAALVSTVAIIVPKMQENQKKLSCQNNLSQLGQIYAMEAMENKGKAQKYSGVALWLSYRKDAKQIRRGDERALICPGDNIAPPDTEDDKKKWDNVNLQNPATDLCSYAARDFVNHPIGAEDKDKQIIGTDRQGANQRTMHHKDAIIVVYDSGDCSPLNREALGIDSESPIDIGPDAKNDHLRKIIYLPQKKD